MFAVKKPNRNGRCDTVSFVDEKGSFRGSAIFESKKKTQKDLEEYKKRMDMRLTVGRRRTKSPQELKVFAIDNNNNQEVSKRKGPNPKKMIG
jgi:hypothetical protein